MGTETSNLESLKRLIQIVYPIQRRRIYVHFRHVKRLLMKEFYKDRWEFDKFLLELRLNTRDVTGTCPFYLSMCGSRPGSRLNYVSRATREEGATFSNSYCFICIDTRSLVVREILKQ